jgi:hypothetical protein
VPILDIEDDPVLDDEGHPTYTESSTSNIRCLLLWEDVSNIDEQGTVIEKRPTMYFDNDQVLREGDIIENVLTRNDTNILHAAVIKTIDTTAEGGNAALKVCELEGAVI